MMTTICHCGFSCGNTYWQGRRSERLPWYIPWNKGSETVETATPWKVTILKLILWWTGSQLLLLISSNYINSIRNTNQVYYYYYYYYYYYLWNLIIIHINHNNNWNSCLHCKKTREAQELVTIFCETIFLRRCVFFQPSVVRQSINSGQNFESSKRGIHSDLQIIASGQKN